MRKLTSLTDNFYLMPEKEGDEKRPCPVCGYPIGVVAGSKEAICTNCGFKDPCCD